MYRIAVNRRKNKTTLSCTENPHGFLFQESTEENNWLCDHLTLYC